MTRLRLARLTPLLIPLLAIPVLWHLLIQGLPQDSADGLLHIYRLALLEKHVAGGILYPRWLPELALGRGYPLFNFYGPASYYLALAFRLAGLPLGSALVAAFAFLIMAAGAGMYLLARDVLAKESRLPALVTATAYMHAPYLLTNAYIRGALAEVAAQALLPWIFWSTGRLMSRREERRLYFLLLALSLAGLAVSHTITLVFLPAAWLAFVVVTWLARGRRRRELAWTLGAAAVAVGISAFFTLPLALERQHLATRAYEIATQTIPISGWTWRNFLDTTPVFKYTHDTPFQIGLIQLALAGLGWLAARRRDALWVYWTGLALVSGLLAGAWAVPLWLSNELLLTAQFQWRLLTLLSLPLALFTGQMVAWTARPAFRATISAGLIALVIWANIPRLPDAWGWRPANDAAAIAGLAQFERDSGAVGTSSAGEFLPKWVGRIEPGPVEPVTGSPVPVLVTAGSDYRITLETEGAQAGPLRLMTFYFPGWRAADETGAPLPLSPSTDAGLLTVEVPAGAHTITIWWEATRIERTGTAVTALALLALSVFALVRRRARPLAPALLLLMVVVGAAVFATPRTAPVYEPSAEVSLDGVKSLGARLQVARDGIWTYPYWYAEETPGPDLRIRWQVRAENGSIALEREARPYHNATSPADWPPNTVVDDAHFLALPQGQPAGSYELWGQLVSASGSSKPAFFGQFDLAQPVRLPPRSSRPLNAVFGQKVALAGYNPPTSAGLPPDGIDAVVRSGDNIRYTLYWQALESLAKNYHGFTHLVDQSGVTLATRDQLAGVEFHYPPSLWSTGNVHPDGYPLRIPPDAPPGVYWPLVGLYEFESLERLPVSAGEFTGQNAARLGPIKVLGGPPRPPQKRLNVRAGDFAQMTGYDFVLPDSGLTPGATFTVTLHFEADSSAPAPYTRFLHLFSPELGMAAQHDSPPGGEANPTWAWVRGEKLSDTATLTIAPDALPGQYQLRVGLYDPAANATRLPLIGPSGERLPDDVAPLLELQVTTPP